MPYGKRHDVSHVTRVPIQRLDSTGEISSDSPSMLEVGSRLNTDSTLNWSGVNLKTMLGKKSLNSLQNNMSANDSSCSYTLIKDLMNMKPVETSNSMVDSQKRSNFSVKDNKFKQAPISWNPVMPTTFHPAVMASTFVPGVPKASSNSVNMSHHSYIPKMTYCNLNRCYQNKFRQKFFKGISSNSQCGSNKRMVSHNYLKNTCDKTMKANTSTDKSCASSPKNTIIQTELPKESMAGKEKVLDGFNLYAESSEGNSDSHDILPVVNHWSDLCSDNEDDEKLSQAVPDCWEEQEENELENNFTKHINNEHAVHLQNDKQVKSESIIAQVEGQNLKNDSFVEPSSGNQNCESYVAQIHTPKKEDEDQKSDIAYCDITMVADEDSRTESCADSVDSAHFQIKINSFQPQSKSGTTDCQDNETNEKDKSFILYIRKDNKKKSKRRRRPKPKKCEENSDSEEHQAETSPPKCQNSAIAFMLGLSPENDNKHSSKPFFISFNESADFSDFSEGDDETFDDGNYSDSEMADEFDMPLNLSVICPIKQLQDEECSKELKEVNLRWQIQISRKPSTCSLHREKSDQIIKKVSRSYLKFEFTLLWFSLYHALYNVHVITWALHRLDSLVKYKQCDRFMYNVHCTK